MKRLVQCTVTIGTYGLWRIYPANYFVFYVLLTDCSHVQADAYSSWVTLLYGVLEFRFYLW